MELLMELANQISPSGNEEAVRDIIKSETESYVDEIYTDSLGNLICRKKGTGRKVMITANMDENGLIAMVTDKNFVRFKNIGNISLNFLQNAKVLFTNGQYGVISYEGMKELEKNSKIDNYYIDIIGDSKIKTGDAATFAPNFTESDNFICSKALSSRIGCYILVNIIQNLKKSDNDLYFVFTVQEELGQRGAKAVADLVKPDFALNVGTTPADDYPDGGKSPLSLGEGPALKIMDSSIISHPIIKELLMNTASELNIKLQYEVSSKERSDVGVISTSLSGVISGGLSIPCRYQHAPTEMANLSDIEKAIKLMTKVCEVKLT